MNETFLVIFQDCAVCIQEDLHNTKSLSLNYLGIFFMNYNLCK